MNRVWLWVVGCALVAASAGWGQAAAPSGKVTITGSWRLRGEAWSWFRPLSGDRDYVFGHSLLRVGVGQQKPRSEWLVELEQPTLIDTPSNATRPGVEGQLGLGATYRAVNGRRDAGLFLKQGYFRLKGLRNASQLRLGRFEFIEGLETMPRDASLAYLKRERVAHRLIGNFGWSLVGRSLDGVNYSQRAAGGTVTLLAAHPTRGVFDLDGWGDLNVNVLYGAFSALLGSERAPGDGRLFLMDYEDNRNLGKTDNRPAAVRAADTDEVHIQTFGGHYLQAVPLGGGKADLLLWVAGQKGDWGRQKHRGLAWAAEAGYQPKSAPWQPWLRVGYFQSSGDGSPDNDTHSTFFSVLPTPRIYARFPFFNQMNNRDAFVQVLAKPHPKWSLRADAHFLRLSSGTDLWYQGGGAFQPNSFGYTGRPAGGRRGLATLFDASLDYQASPAWSATFYAAVAQGKGVIEAIYPRGAKATLVYAELLRKW